MENREDTTLSKDEFLSLAAHEIRTPITVLKAQAQLAQRFQGQGNFQGEVVDRTLETIVRESDRLAKLCTDLLDIARLDSGLLPLEMQCFELSALIEREVEKIKGMSKFHSFQVEIEKDIRVSADAERTSQVVGTILNNAIRFSPAGGEIRVKVFSDANWGFISVVDQGLGLSAEMLQSVFRRYFRGHLSGLKGRGGLGLGLYLAREILLKMGGSIEVKSEGLGLGTAVTFSLQRG